MLNNLKNIFVGVLSAVIIIAVGASAYNAFASPNAQQPSAPALIDNYGQGNGNGGGQGGVSIPASDLSAEETAGLLFMREEEKLARDVYNQLYVLWGQPIFQNIAASEQAHMDEIKLLLDRYGMTDPILAEGQFSDANLQSLYNQLMAQGAISIEEALKVGALIEETDIKDLQARLAQSDNADIQQVYNSLMAGSYNHLAAFTGQQGGQGQGGQGQGSSNGIPQASSGSASAFHGTVAAFDGMGISLNTDDEQALYIQLGNQNYVQSIGFMPQVGEGLTVNAFIGSEGLYAANNIVMDASGQTYTFRDSSGRPSWAGGNGKGGGNH